MTDFILDKRLEHDCLPLGTLYGIHLLLMNNSKVPWFVLVPETTVTELYELEPPLKAALAKAVDALSRVTKETLQAEKLNVAAIGNVVSQMHIHVVGRATSDFCWPHPVWGASGGTPYQEAEVTTLVTTLKASLSNNFVTPLA